MVKKTIKKYKIKRVIRKIKKGGSKIGNNLGNIQNTFTNKQNQILNSSRFSEENDKFNYKVIFNSIKELLHLAQNGKELKQRIVTEIEDKVNDLKPEDSPFLFQLKETALELLSNINNYIEKCTEIMMANNIDNKKKNWYKMVLAADLICYLPEPVIKLISQKVESALSKISGRNTILSASDKVSNNAFKNMLEILKSIFDIYYKVCAIKNKIANIYLAIEKKEPEKNEFHSGGMRIKKIKTKKIKKRYLKIEL